jgi:hypothetical protein
LYRSLIERFEDKTDTGAWCLAIELMKKASSLCFIHTGKDPIMPYAHFFKNGKGLSNIPFFDKAGELFDFTGFDKLESVNFQMSDGAQPSQAAEETEMPQALSTDQIDGFVQKIPPSVKYVSFNNIATIEHLSNAYAASNKMKETRPELDTHININIGFSKLIGLKDVNPALFKWAAQKTTYLNDMDFLQYEDQMHLFDNITNINNFVITNKDGTLNRSTFHKLHGFNKLQYIGLSCSKWGQSIPDNALDSTSFDVIVDQLPRSLQSISIYHLSSVKWDDFEPFIETLATRRPSLRIDMNGSKSVLQGRPRMMHLVDSGRIEAN